MMHHVQKSLLFGLCWMSLLLFTACKKAEPVVVDPPPPPPPPQERSVDVQCSGSTMTIAVMPNVPKQPTFPQAADDISLESLQCDFDVFSWNSFLALSHGVDGAFGTGVAGPGKGDNFTVWESWPESNEVFLADGAEPPVWNAGDPAPPPPAGSIPPECEALAKERPALRLMRQIGKRPNLAEASDQPFQSGPLIDVNGHYSRFEITVNQPMYQYIHDHGIYSKAGQTAFDAAGHTVNFPCGCNAPTGGGSEPATCPPDGNSGALMVKAAWKVLDPDKDQYLDGRIHRSEILVYTPESSGQPATCEPQFMGLVGLHIGHKTQESPQWVWSTFEHVDNVPTLGQAPDKDSYNFFQTDCPDDDPCHTVNQAPPQPWDPHNQPVTTNAGKSQIERAIAIDAATTTMNDAVQGMLDGTVWQNYDLVSTQWPTNAAGSNSQSADAANGWCTGLNPTDNTGNPAPTFLANTTLESYIQGSLVGDSNCIKCHLEATMAEGANNFSDFTYLLERAQ